MSGVLYNVVASAIFVFVAINFLFPCNSLIPLDRRTTSVLGALLCYLTRRFIFTNATMDVIDAVDFDVMILLSSIMIINHIVVHLTETKEVIDYLQQLVKADPVRGFWIISLAAFLASPFLTNDGVCLLFVEPILAAFESAPFAIELAGDTTAVADPTKITLRKEDALYFLLGLACSANIGSSLTYTGNPQNMIVASDSIRVLPSYKFLIYMLPAALFSWFLTLEWIRRCWMSSRTLPLPEQASLQLTHTHLRKDSKALRLHSRQGSARSKAHSRHESTGSHASRSRQGSLQLDMPDLDNVAVSPTKSPTQPTQPGSFWNLAIFGGDGAAMGSPAKAVSSPLSPRRRQALQRAKMVKRVTRVVSSPFPYIVLILLGLMILMIFVDVMPISGLICVFAILMVVVVVVGNHYRDRQLWFEEEEETVHAPTHEGASAESQRTEVSYNAMESARHPAEDLGPLTREDKLDNLNQFFEALFNSIDYSLLIIFLGLFIVVENVASTGLPARIWGNIVGKNPFGNASSIAGISLFVLLASQFLGNVAVIQLAKPNIEDLDDSTKRLAWAVISFVATVGGNLTIPGSAANIIVAEKAARLDATMSIDFFQHYKVCFWVTMLSCTVGAIIISMIAFVDNATGSNW